MHPHRPQTAQAAARATAASSMHVKCDRYEKVGDEVERCIERSERCERSCGYSDGAALRKQGS